MKKTPIKKENGYHFDKENHVHTLDGKPLNGITTVLGVISKPALIPWAVKTAVDYIEQNLLLTKVRQIDLDNEDTAMWAVSVLKEAKSAHRKKKEEAGASGSGIHETIENLLKGLIERQGGIFKGDEKSDNPQIQHFIDWAVENKVKFLESEKHLYSRTNWIGGICDFVCEIDKKIFVGDVKTASGIYPENFLQMGAYSLMLDEMGEYKNISGLVVVNLKKDGTMETKQSFDVAGNREAFLSALKLYRALEFLK